MKSLVNCSNRIYYYKLLVTTRILFIQVIHVGISLLTKCSPPFKSTIFFSILQSNEVYLGIQNGKRMKRVYDILNHLLFMGIIVLLMSCWLVIACGSPQENAERSEESAEQKGIETPDNQFENFPFPEGIVAIVNGHTISDDDLARRLRNSWQRAELSNSEHEATLDALRKNTLEQLIEQTLIEQLANQENIDVSEEELRQRIAEVRQEYQGQEIRAIVREQGESYDTWIQTQRDALLLDKVVQIYLGNFLTVTDEDARRYYEEHLKLYEHPAQIRASQILTYDTSTARQALHMLNEGGDFADVAKIYSESPDAEQGGDLGFVAAGVLPPELEDAIFSLSMSEVSDIVKTPYGYHIFMLTGQRASQHFRFDEVKAQILTMMRQQKRIASVDLWISELQKNAKILVNYERIQHIK